MSQENESRKKSVIRAKTIARDVFAGTIAGINVTLIGHPFDTLKVRLQTQPSNPPVYNGLVDCFQKTIKWEGIQGLYKGVGSPIAGQMFFRANMFLSFAEAKRWLSGYGERQNTIQDYYLAGAFAWATGALFECPIDLIKSQLQVQIIKAKRAADQGQKYTAPFSNMAGCARTIIKSNGFSGLYQGLAPHLMRNIPAGSMHLGTFELVRMYFAEKQQIKPSQLPTGYNLLAGGVGGFLYWFLFFPIDVVKSTLQADNIQRSDRRFNGMIHATKTLYAEGGWRRFYRGFSPCLMRSVPANALMLWTVAFLTDRIPIAASTN